MSQKFDWFNDDDEYQHDWLLNYLNGSEYQQTFKRQNLTRAALIETFSDPSLSNFVRKMAGAWRTQKSRRNNPRKMIAVSGHAYRRLEYLSKYWKKNISDSLDEVLHRHSGISEREAARFKNKLEKAERPYRDVRDGVEKIFDGYSNLLKTYIQDLTSGFEAVIDELKTANPDIASSVQQRLEECNSQVSRTISKRCSEVDSEKNKLLSVIDRTLRQYEPESFTSEVETILRKKLY